MLVLEPPVSATAACCGTMSGATARRHPLLRLAATSSAQSERLRINVSYLAVYQKVAS